jgi:hypothetical protein
MLTSVQFQERKASMKKARTLKLSRETLRQIAPSDLEGLKGGAPKPQNPDTGPASCHWICGNSQGCSAGNTFCNACDD